MNKTILAAVALALATPATATTYTITYTGTVTNGFDYEGIFGDPADSFESTFTAVFKLDTAAKDAVVTSSINQWSIEGYGKASPAPSTLTINGKSFAFGDYLSLVAVANEYPSWPNYSDSIWAAASNYSFKESLSVRIFTQTGNYIPSTQIQPLDYFAQAGDYNDGSFQLRDPLTGIWRAGGTLLSNRVTVVETGAIPEPSTWAMMIGGFALAGGALRQRPTRRVARAV
jgi:hypothetical protein